jgi:hypothetical protein
MAILDDEPALAHRHREACAIDVRIRRLDASVLTLVYWTKPFIGPKSSAA